MMLTLEVLYLVQTWPSGDQYFGSCQLHHMEMAATGCLDRGLLEGSGECCFPSGFPSGSN